MPIFESAGRTAGSRVPTAAEWERSSGGRAARGVPLLRYIDARVNEHAIYRRYVERHDKMKFERLASLVELWYATRMYLKGQGGAAATVGRTPAATRPAAAASTGRAAQVDANPGDAVRELEAAVAADLMALTGTPPGPPWCRPGSR